MRALTMIPGVVGSARWEDVAEPPESDGPVLIEAIAAGVCGTDLEILAGDYGTAPPGSDRLILGHESIGRVLKAPDDCGLRAGDLVVGIVRRPDPVPCPSCAAGEWDMCRNGGYTERGIKALHGFCSERFRLEPRYAVKVDGRLGHLGVLLEPASVLAKAWEQIERIGRRSFWAPRTVLVTGAGPIGLLAALMGVQRGLEVHVFDRVVDGPKPDLVRRLGAVYHSEEVGEIARSADIVVECTGVGQLVFEILPRTPPGSIVCLTGISSGGRSIPIDVGALNTTLVLENDVVFGSVNANRRHYDIAADVLARADQSWLQPIVSREVSPERWQDAVTRRPGDVKTVIRF